MKLNRTLTLTALTIALTAAWFGLRNNAPTSAQPPAKTVQQPSSCPEIPNTQYHVHGDASITHITCDAQKGTTLDLSSGESIWLLLDVKPDNVAWFEPIVQNSSLARMDCSLSMNDISGALFENIQNAGSLPASGFTTVSLSCTGSGLLVNIVYQQQQP